MLGLPPHPHVVLGLFVKALSTDVLQLFMCANAGVQVNIPECLRGAGYSSRLPRPLVAVYLI